MVDKEPETDKLNGRVNRTDKQVSTWPFFDRNTDAMVQRSRAYYKYTMATVDKEFQNSSPATKIQHCSFFRYVQTPAIRLPC